jgi:hypothetical protein
MARYDIHGIGEIDEETIRASVQTRNYIANLLKDPRKKKILESLHDDNVQKWKEAVSAPDPLEEKVSPLLSKVEALEKRIADDAAARENERKLSALTSSIEAGLDRLRREQGLTDEGVAGVRKIMEDEGITKPEIAWAHFQQLHPPQQPITPSGSGAWNFMEPPADDQADLKRLIETKGENVPLVDKMVRDTLADLRGQARR